MKNIVFTLILFLSSILTKPVQAQNLNPDESPLQTEASYTGDNVNNLHGGIKKGSCYLGMANIHIGFNTEKANLWKGGQFYINAANTHGSCPSAELLGDMQVASNIEAGNHSYFQELWYKQQIGNFELTVGLQDLNVEFANSENGSLYLNSSFGILPTISNNFAAPIFPLTTLGFTTKWNISDKSSWINAIYDGNPTDFDYNPYNVKWQFISGDGILAVSEYQHSINIKNLPGTVKAGAFAHTHLIEKGFGNEIPDSLDQNIFGFYTYADQTLWRSNNQNIGFFTQMGFSPGNNITNSFYLGMGFNFTGIFNKKGKDILGVALANEHFKHAYNCETAVELTYQYHITDNLFIQPDIQYIIHPSGTGEALDNSFTGNLRFGFSF